MPIPTLLTAGSLVGKSDVETKALSNHIAIDYIMTKFQQWLGGSTERVLVLLSDVGSGKSTVLPAQTYKTFMYNTKSRRGRTLAITQPKVLLAKNKALELGAPGSFYPYLEFGKNLGSLTKDIKKMPSEGIVFMTVGILSQQFKFWEDDQIIKKYSFIMIDEAHEISQALVLLLFQIKLFIKRNEYRMKDLPMFVFMSATLSIDMYLQYFGTTTSITVKGDDLGKRTYHYMTSIPQHNTFIGTTMSLLEKNYINILKAPSNDTRTDTIVFLPGQKEIGDLEKLIDGFNRALVKRLPDAAVFYVVQLTSDAVKDPRQSNRLYAPITKTTVTIDGKVHRVIGKVILATNVAEMGVTIPTLQWVIDSGYKKAMNYYPIYNITGLITVPISKNSLTQRAGRVGRVLPGEYHGTFTKSILNHLHEFDIPDVSHENMDQTILSQIFIMEKMGAKVDISNLDTINMLSYDMVQRCVEKYHHLGLMATDGMRISDIGKICQRLYDLPIEATRSILGSYVHHIRPLDMVTIAAYGKVLSDDRSRRKFQWAYIYGESGIVPMMLSNNHRGGSADDPRAVIGEVDYEEMRLLIGCDFIDGLILWMAIIAHLDNLFIFSERSGVALYQIIEFIAARDGIIEGLMSCNINVLDGDVYGADKYTILSSDTLISYLVKVKRCLYDGYRMNLLTYDNKIGSYRTANGLKVGLPSLFAKPKHHTIGQYPTYLLYHTLNLGYNRKGCYDITPYCVSMLDTYVNPDLRFGNRHLDGISAGNVASGRRTVDANLERYDELCSLVPSDRLPCYIYNTLKRKIGTIEVTNKSVLLVKDNALCSCASPCYKIAKPISGGNNQSTIGKIYIL